MQNRVIAIFLLCLVKSTLSFNAARFDPLTLALEQILSEITFEIVPCPTYPNGCYDGPISPCPIPIGPSCPQLYLDPCECSTYPPPPTSIGCLPYDLCDQCGDIWPTCSCYRDIVNPCCIFEDSSPIYICFESCNCECASSPPPYIYFPEVEYPMTAMDMRPYYFGSCWCS